MKTVMSPEDACDWIKNSIPFVRAEVARGKLRVTVSQKDSAELAKRLSRTDLFDVSAIEITIHDAPFRHIGAWTRNPAVDGLPSVMAVHTTVAEILSTNR